MPATTMRRPTRLPRRATALLCAWLSTAAPVAGANSPALPPDLAAAVATLERQLDAHPYRVADPALEAHLHRVACRLDAAACAGLRPRVLREPGFNASAVPGGLLVVRTGALLRTRDEDELAVLVAHELAHLRRGDAIRRWTANGPHRPRSASGDVDAEEAADRLAIALLAAAGYDVGAGARLFGRLLAEESSGDGGEDGRERTHPLTAERLAGFRAAAAADDRPGPAATSAWPAPIAHWRAGWLADEVARGDLEATVAMLRQAGADRDDADPVDAFALAQALRRRDGTGDRRAAAAIVARLASGPAPAAAVWREHGLARLAAGDRDAARAALGHYLVLAPAADDHEFVRAMRAETAPGPSDGAAPADPARPTAVLRASTGAGEPVAAVAPTAALREWRPFDLRMRSALAWKRQPGIGMEQWTIDGAERNRLWLLPGLRDGEPLFRDAGSPRVRHRAGLRPDEVRDRLATALHAAGWLDVHADGPRPFAFGDRPGWRMRLRLADAAGLEHRGLAAFSEREGRLTLLLWLAPAGHYHRRDEAAVAAMFDSLRFDD